MIRQYMNELNSKRGLTKMIKRKKIISNIFIVFSLMSLAACNNNEAKSQEQELFETPVAVGNVFTGSLSGSNQITGVAKAAVDVQVIPKSVGQLLDVLVENGQYVEEGQVLAQIDNRDQELSHESDTNTLQQAENGLKRAQNGLVHAQNNHEQAKNGLKQVEANIAEVKQTRDINIKNQTIQVSNAQKQWEDAKTSLNRMKVLFDEGLISKQQFEEVESAEKRAKNGYEQSKISLTQVESELSLKTLEANLQQAKINVQSTEAGIRDAEIALKDAQVAVEQSKIVVEMGKNRIQDTQIVAPISGQINGINARKGEFVSNQSPFTTIISTDMIEVEISIPGEQLILFELGDLLKVRFAGVEEDKEGKVTFISTTAADSGLFTVEIQVNNEDKKVRPGMIATVTVEELLVAQSLIVPTSAVVERQGVAFIFVIQGENAVQKEVQIVRYDTDYTAITGEITEKDQVVIKGQNLLSDGDPIRIVKEEK